MTISIQAAVERLIDARSSRRLLTPFSLKPGDVVMSGAISKMLRPKVGDTVRASFTHLGSVSIKVVP